jgi:hypothetical protein
MEAEVEAITEAIVEICTFMRGSITWDQAWNLTGRSIKKIKKQIKRNIELTQKNGIAIV